MNDSYSHYENGLIMSTLCSHNTEHDSIASVREQTSTVGGDLEDTFRTLSGREILRHQGLHLIRVPTIEPILNPLWFLGQIDQAQERFVDKYLKHDDY